MSAFAAPAMQPMRWTPARPLQSDVRSRTDCTIGPGDCSMKYRYQHWTAHRLYCAHSLRGERTTSMGDIVSSAPRSETQ